jgi:Zn-dependent membrane protease YugP
MSFWGWYIDPVYFLIFVVTLLISIGAQIMVSSAYRKWSAVKNSAGFTGGQVGQTIIQKTGLGVDHKALVQVETPELQKLADLRDKGIVTAEQYEAKRKQLEAAQAKVVTSHIKLARTPGQMTDHYDPRSHTVRMSDGVATRPSVAAMAIVAHELGHAQQHENNSFLITMRNLLVPAVNFSSPLAYVCIFFGFLFNLAGLVTLGIVFYAIMVIFTFVTLPVEFDASRRGLQLLDQSGLMRADTDRQGSQQVLRAAAMTYVAAAVTAVLQLLYYLRLAGRGRR